MTGTSSLPRISIVTPSFNQVEFVEQTLRSVLDQGYPNLEYVVVDGGSADGSADVIQSYADQLAYWVSEPDGGHADGLNKGFRRTTGEIMGWINSSDIYYPWTLATVASVFRDVPQARWIMGVPTLLDDGSGPKDVRAGGKNIYDILGGNYRWIQQESVFWRRDLWEAAGGSLADLRACDFELWLRFFRHTELYQVRTVLGGFRFHEDRRALEGENEYRREARRLQQEFVASFPERRYRIRAGLVRATNSRPGKVIRQGLGASGVWPWYRHPVIAYDFDRRRWRVITR